MTIKKLLEKYYFHDSSVISAKKQGNDIEFEILFCTWMQNYYDEKNMPKNELIVLTFKNAKTDFEETAINAKTSFDVLDAKVIKQNGKELGVCFSGEILHDYFEINVFSTEVDFSVQAAFIGWGENDEVITSDNKNGK